MRFVFLALSLGAAALGIVWLLVARTAIHEIQSFILLLIAAVLGSAAGIMEAIHQLRQDTHSLRDIANIMLHRAKPGQDI